MTARRTINALLSKPENAVLERIRQVRNQLNGEQISVVIVVLTKKHTFWRVAGQLETVDEVGETADTLS